LGRAAVLAGIELQNPIIRPVEKKTKLRLTGPVQRGAFGNVNCFAGTAAGSDDRRLDAGAASGTSGSATRYTC
jgi:hypothetical protein